jgi:hypothetical protein
VAQQSGVQHIVKLAQLHAHTGSTERFLRYHGSVEAVIQASGLTFTFLRPNLFMQGLLNFRQSIQQKSAFFAAASDARISAVDIRDLVDVAVAALALLADDFIFHRWIKKVEASLTLGCTPFSCEPKAKGSLNFANILANCLVRARHELFEMGCGDLPKEWRFPNRPFQTDDDGCGVQPWTSRAVNFDVLAVDPFYRGVVGPRKPVSRMREHVGCVLFTEKKSFRAAGQLRRISAARDGSNLEGLCHRGIDVQNFYKVIDSGMKMESHRGLMNDFARAVADHCNAQNFLRSRVGNHLD